MDWITVLGLAAAFLTTISQLPQALKTIKTKHTADISLTTYLVLTIGVLVWLVYGLLVSDVPLIAANAVTFLLTSTIVVMKLRYG